MKLEIVGSIYLSGISFLLELVQILVNFELTRLISFVKQ